MRSRNCSKTSDFCRGPHTPSEVEEETLPTAHVGCEIENPEASVQGPKGPKGDFILQLLEAKPFSIKHQVEDISRLKFAGLEGDHMLGNHIGYERFSLGQLRIRQEYYSCTIALISISLSPPPPNCFWEISVSPPPPPRSCFQSQSPGPLGGSSRTQVWLQHFQHLLGDTGKTLVVCVGVSGGTCWLLDTDTEPDDNGYLWTEHRPSWKLEIGGSKLGFGCHGHSICLGDGVDNSEPLAGFLSGPLPRRWVTWDLCCFVPSLNSWGVSDGWKTS